MQPAIPVSHKDRRHPLFLSYGANLPSSLTRSTPDRSEASHLGTPVSDLGTGTKVSWTHFFQCPSVSSKQAIWSAILVSDEFSSLRHSPVLDQLNKATTLLALTQGKNEPTITTPRWHSNINEFPSSCNAVGITLRTGLLLVDDALPGKPCPFDHRDSHPTTLLLPPGSALESRSMGSHDPTSTQPLRPPTTNRLIACCLKYRHLA